MKNLYKGRLSCQKSEISWLPYRSALALVPTKASYLTTKDAKKESLTINNRHHVRFTEGSLDGQCKYGKSS